MELSFEKQLQDKKIASTESCAICIEQLEPCPVSTLSCGHTFHRLCITKTVFQLETRCPICRQEIFELDGIKLPKLTQQVSSIDSDDDIFDLASSAENSDEEEKIDQGLEIQYASPSCTLTITASQTIVNRLIDEVVNTSRRSLLQNIDHHRFCFTLLWLFGLSLGLIIGRIFK